MIKKTKKITTSYSYSKEHDILTVYWKDKNDEYDVSEEFTTQNGNDFVVDFDKKGRILGIEIFDFNNPKNKPRRRKK